MSNLTFNVDLRLEDSADRLFKNLCESQAGDPFAFSCVVVPSRVCADWLRTRFLDAAAGEFPRRILSNVEFIHSYPFFATLSRGGGDGFTDIEAETVLSFRIDSLLADLVSANDPASRAKYRMVFDYLDAEPVDPGKSERRDFLARKLARLFFSYRRNAPRMLDDWAERRAGTEIGRPDLSWEAEFFRDLLARGGDPSVPALFGESPLREGSLRWRSIHVFDVPNVEPRDRILLEKVSGQVPVSVYAPTLVPPDSPFAAWARGSRSWIREEAPRSGVPSPDELDFPDGNLGALQRHLFGMESNDPGGTDSTVTVFDNFSPRRELEALRDFLLRWFSERSETHPHAHPSDVLVLFGRWADYAPFVDGVFGADGRIPYKLAGAPEAVPGPIVRGFLKLLELRGSRLPYSQVASLLEEPAIREAFGFSETDVARGLRLARDVNVRWGFDDEHVDSVLGNTERLVFGNVSSNPSDRHPYRHTWRRGLDRLLLGSFEKPSPGEDDKEFPELSAEGRLGNILVKGLPKESDSESVFKLDRFVRAVNDARNRLEGLHGADAWFDVLSDLVETFFVPRSEEEALDRGILRRRLAEWKASADAVREAIGKDLPKEPSSVFAKWLTSRVERVPEERDVAGNAVTFAPLRPGYAMPHRLVCLCGLNGDAFPRKRPGTDELDVVDPDSSVSMRNPAAMDESAFLDAVLSARETLLFSYVGRDARTREELQPSLLVRQLKDSLSPGFVWSPVRHALCSYDIRYFSQKPELPPSYSAGDRSVVEALSKSPVARESNIGYDMHICPFEPDEPCPEGVDALEHELRTSWTIHLEDLVSFFTNPHRYLLRKRLGIRLSRKSAEQQDAETYRTEIKPYDSFDIQAAERMNGKELLVEKGSFDSISKARDAIDEFVRPRKKTQERALQAQNIGGEGAEVHIENVRFDPIQLSVEGRKVWVVGELDFVRVGDFRFRNCTGIADLALAWIQHIVGHAALANRTHSSFQTRIKQTRYLNPMDSSEARTKLCDLVKLALLHWGNTPGIPFPASVTQGIWQSRNNQTADLDLDKVRDSIRKCWDSTDASSSFAESVSFFWPNPFEMSDEQLNACAEWAEIFWSGCKKILS